jgi:hypothetical protein
MICFICNQNESNSTFYCKLCKKNNICLNCWKIWLQQSFICPFCKQNTFIQEINETNKNLILTNNDDQIEFSFTPFNNIYNNGKNITYENDQIIPLNNIITYYTGFYNDVFHSIELSYYHIIKSFNTMKIVQTTYDKWILSIILNQIMYDNFTISHNDIQYFGGKSFISFINNYFNYKIIISQDIEQSHIRFNNKLWSPKLFNSNEIQTCIMKYMYNTLNFMYFNLNNMIISRIHLNTNFISKHIYLYDLFIAYFYAKLNNNLHIDSNDDENASKSEYSFLYLTRINNKYFII